MQHVEAVEQAAAMALYGCLLQLGEQGSNPVLEVLSGTDRIEPGRHYPQPYLEFGQQGLRAYYHSHSHPQGVKTEHGHFHIFRQIDEEHWSHLAALAMDGEGQPMCWLSTNRWVTDEYWQASDALSLQGLPQLDEDRLNLVERWLYLILQVYRPELQQLWQQRDAYVTSMSKERDGESILDNHDYYILSQRPIELLNKMQSLLVDEENGIEERG